MFIEKPKGVAEGNVLEIRVAYDEYGIVSLQQAPLDDEPFDAVKAIEVLEAALEIVQLEMMTECIHHIDDRCEFSGESCKPTTGCQDKE